MVTRKEWYNTRFVVMEIVKSLIHRETVFLPFYQDESDGKIKAQRPIRNLNASYDGMLQRHWDEFGFLDDKMNLYGSVVTFANAPMFSYNWRIKSQEQEIWNQKFQDYIVGIDWFTEFDSDTLFPAIEDGKKFKSMLDGYKIRYSCVYSGSKGLHFTIPYDELSFLGLQIFNKAMEQKITKFNKYMTQFPVKLNELGKIADLVLLFKTINVRMKLIFGLDTLDQSISDIRRIKKIPYSYDVKSNKICLPLDDVQLANFSKKIVEPDNVMRDVRIFKRGQLWRNENIDKKIREQGILSLLQDLDILV